MKEAYFIFAKPYVYYHLTVVITSVLQHAPMFLGKSLQNCIKA